MTDEEFIKAYCCCSQCPYYVRSLCRNRLDEDVCELIQKQEEIINTQRCEIANLQEKLDYIENSLKTDFCGVPCDFMEEVASKQAKNAIKEFAEKLHTKMTKCGYSGTEKLVMCPEKEIDNLAKEMIGDE